MPQFPEYELTQTKNLFARAEYKKFDLERPPGRSHSATCIKTAKFGDSYKQFVDELNNTITNFVHSPEDFSRVVSDLIENEGRDHINAVSEIVRSSKERFKSNNHQGQFGELFGFNVLEHFFRAVPLLRKMPATSSTEQERFGADAIHYRADEEEGVHELFVGEVKCYTEKTNASKAVRDSIQDVKKHAGSLDEELQRYTVDNFVSKPLKKTAHQIRSGKIDNIRLHYLALAIYYEHNIPQQESDIDWLARVVNERYSRMSCPVNQSNATQIAPTLHHFLFPVNNLDRVLRIFGQYVGTVSG